MSRRERGAPWGAKPSQPIECCIQHTIAMIVRGMEEEQALATGKYDAAVTHKEAVEWAKRVKLIAHTASVKP